MSAGSIHTVVLAGGSAFGLGAADGVMDGDLPSDQDLVGTLAAAVVSEAILRAVQNSESAYGFLSIAEMNR